MKKSEDNPDIKVLKTASCLTLSGKSKLSYQVGLSPESVVHLRISKNSGNGFFSDEWLSIDSIVDTLKKRPEGKPITSILLNPLFKGRSANTPGFMMAVLLHEMETITCMITFLMPWNSSLLGICPMMNWPMP